MGAAADPPEEASTAGEDLEAAPLDQMSRHEFMSLRGADAKFKASSEEVERILHVQKNYYAILKVRKDTPSSEVRANYYKVSRLVHPDKCAHPNAAAAAAAVNQAYDTLSNPVKKVLYDRYVDDAGDLDAPEGVSYADWEREQAVNVEIPAWMEKILRIPGGGICLLIILLPVTLLLVAVCVVLFVLCLPLRLALAFCCGVKLQPPHPGGPNIPDDDEPVIIDIQPPAPASATPATATRATAPSEEVRQESVGGPGGGNSKGGDGKGRGPEHSAALLSGGYQPPAPVPAEHVS